MPLESAESYSARVERLFHDCLETEPGSRDAFLATACLDDAPLRLAVQKLLDAFARVGRKPFWNEPALQSEVRQGDLIAGEETLERYRLTEPIGAGGMGIVYKAVRSDDEFSKVVAIKIVQIGAASLDSIVRRFRQERQILAGLDHPNIARLLDGGSTPGGLPFLVMDYVDGVPIDRYLAAKKPPLREILELFRTVCSAVSHAHHNLVVHRDLKPGNILVTTAGIPKLLDFGIAKLLDGTSEKTQTGVGGMTPEYASPEQVRGAPVTTASDAYSLGVLLYELLCGARPYRATTNPMELAQAICAESPPPMSTRSPRKFDADIENIVQMALRKEPERRYASVEQFSEDLRRYMDGYPVSARPATLGYQARRFAGRNKGFLGVTALLLLTLISGIAATAWEARLANQRFNDVRELANSYLFEFHDAIKDLPGATPARQLVVKRGMQYLDKLASQRGHDAALQRDLANAYEKVGQVQGAPHYPSLGDRAGALATYRKALALREPLAASHPENTEIGLELNRSYRRIGELLQLVGDLNAAVTIERKSISSLEKLAAARPLSPPVSAALADIYCSLADVTGNNETPNLGDARGAIELYRKAQVIRERLVADHPDNREYLFFLGVGYAYIAQLQQALNNKEESAAAFRRCLTVDEQLIREDPLNVEYRRNAAVAYRSLALILIRMRNLGEAQKNGDRSAALFEQIAKQDPANLEAREEYGDSLWSQGYLRELAKDWAPALKYFESSIAIYNTVAAKRGGLLPIGLRTVNQLMSDLGIEMGDTDKAMQSAQNELEIDRRLLLVNPGDAGAQRNRGVAFTQIGKVHETLGLRKASSTARQTAEWREARSWYQRGLDVWLELRKKGTLIPMYAPKVEEATRNVARCNRALGL